MECAPHMAQPKQVIFVAERRRRREVKHMTQTQLRREAKTATAKLKGKTVLAVWRHRASEIGIEFSDGTRMFVDTTPTGLELSITVATRRQYLFVNGMIVALER